jgi:alkanesulfonate monooxygenase SsuD/methylene tetrahydromethanopterin reductase-like flavin-dependent oxidoreductase (luciferase family)
MKIGIRLAGPSSVPVNYDDILKCALTADELGFDSGWISDHLMWPKAPHDCLEAWTVMAALAARTRNLRLAFSMLNPSFRAPAVLAKMAATLDQISRGRLWSGPLK